jgi:uncharacterized protein (DUF1778 family)
MSDPDKHITIRAPKDLREAIKAYAGRRGTNVTQLTLDYYRALIAAEMKQEAEQV